MTEPVRNPTVHSGSIKYDCMAFGWFHEFLYEERVENLAAAEAWLKETLEANAMIVHAYRETDSENPELIGRHGRLCAFISGDGSGIAGDSSVYHEICRFLLDNDCVELWQRAREREVLIDSRWSVVDLYPLGDGSGPPVYGKAMLRRPKSPARAIGSSSSV